MKSCQKLTIREQIEDLKQKNLHFDSVTDDEAGTMKAIIKEQNRTTSSSALSNCFHILSQFFWFTQTLKQSQGILFSLIMD